MSPALTKLLARAVCFRVRELPAGHLWYLLMLNIVFLMILRLRDRSSHCRDRSRSPPFGARSASSHHAPRQPPSFEAPPQPSTSGWVPPGPPPPRSRHDSSGSDSGASGSESVTAPRDSASVRLTELIYKVCPASRPLFDPKAPRCEFEGWFGQPEASTSSQRFRLYPRVAEVQEEVAARAESLARRSKPLSRMLPARARSFSVADDTIFSAFPAGKFCFCAAHWSQNVGYQALGLCFVQRYGTS